MASIAFEHKHTAEGYITFDLKVISGKFSGASSFCISDKSLRDAVSCLGIIYNDLNGTCQIDDYDSSDFVLFEFLKFGHLKISGQVGGCHRDNYLVYQLETDQTVLEGIISDFCYMLEGDIGLS